jgi:dTDP-glucose 4,6-dehydratase
MAIHPKRILVTGGLGFIGSHFVELALKRGYHVLNVDKQTYAIRKDLKFTNHPEYEYIKADICDLKSLPTHITHIVNFAAESHVDNSIANSQPFFKSNIQGVYNLLELVRKLPEKTRPVFLQISTDEVYGDILEGSFKETDRLKPSSPYSASKAAADQLVIGWARTYGIKFRIHRGSNNYGYGQWAEKLIPRTMKLAKKGIRMQVHGSGTYKREWTWVEDNCASILLILEKGKDGEIYNVTSGEEHTNLEIVRMALKAMDKPEDFYDLVPNRPGQDERYAINSDKIRSLGWRPSMTVERFLPICRRMNEERTRNMPPGRKERLARMVGLGKVLYPHKYAEKTG